MGKKTKDKKQKQNKKKIVTKGYKNLPHSNLYKKDYLIIYTQTYFKQLQNEMNTIHHSTYKLYIFYRQIKNGRHAGQKNNNNNHDNNNNNNNKKSAQQQQQQHNKNNNTTKITTTTTKQQDKQTNKLIYN